MSVFDGLGKAEIKGRNPYFAADSQFRVELTEISFFDSNNPDSNTLHTFKIKGKIKESTCPDYHEIVESERNDKIQKDLYTGKPGVVACQLIAFTPRSLKAARGNVKQFLIPLFQEMQKTIRESYADRDDFTDGDEFNEEGWIEAADEAIAAACEEDEEFAEFWTLLTEDPDSDDFGNDHAELAYGTTVFEGTILGLTTNTGGNGFVYCEWAEDPGEGTYYG